MLFIDGCSSKENLFGQPAFLMNAMYIASPSGDLCFHGMIITSEVSVYNCPYIEWTNPLMGFW